MTKCYHCGSSYEKQQLIQVRYEKTGEPVLLCPECIMKGTSGADLLKDWD